MANPASEPPLAQGRTGLTTDQRIGIGTDSPEAMLDIRSERGSYDAARRDWPAPSQLHISPARDESAGAYIGSKTENHFYAAAGIRRYGRGSWEILSNLGAGIYSTLDGGHNFFCVPPDLAGTVTNPSRWIRVCIDPEGNMGVGTRAPSERLDVRGRVRCEDVLCPRYRLESTAGCATGPSSGDGGEAQQETVSLLDTIASMARTVGQLQREVQELKAELESRPSA
jgi:hypothetical protein